MKTILRLVCLSILVSSGFTTVRAEDWKQFRGQDGLGAAASESAPIKFSETQNLAWKQELPGRGLASPIIIGDTVFVTACEGAKQELLSILAFDVETGRDKWKRTIPATGPTNAHPDNNMAAPTPVSDGKVIVALFGTNDVFCTDRLGNVMWTRTLFKDHPGATDGRGLASSPVIVDETVILLVENPTTSFAAGLDLKNGKTRWNINRPKQANWTTPIISRCSGSSENRVILQGSKLVSAYVPATGKEVWRLEQDFDSIASCTLAGSTLLLPTSKGLAAFELTSDDKTPKQIWLNAALGPRTASLVVAGNRVYSSRGPILVSANLKDGKEVGQLRLKGAFSSSPILAGGHLYLFNDNGVCFVVKPDAKAGTIVEENSIKQRIQCTPAVANGSLFVRSDKVLLRFRSTADYSDRFAELKK